MKARIQEFRPRALDRILRTAATPPGHPDLDDLASMAEDTIAGRPFTPAPAQVEAAKQTLARLTDERKKR